MVKEILDQPFSNQLIHQEDSAGYSHWMNLNTFNVQPQVLEYVLKTPLVEEFGSGIDIGGCMYLIALFGRVNNLKAVFKLLLQKKEFMEQFYMQLLTVKEEQTILDLCVQTIDYKKENSSIEMKQEVTTLITKVLPQAIRYCQDDMNRWGKMLGEFFRCCKVQFDQDGPDCDLAELAK